jgi:DNA-binding SARP family transcriptional activator
VRCAIGARVFRVSLTALGFAGSSGPHPVMTGGKLQNWAVADVLDAALSATGAEIAEIFLREPNSDGVSLAGFRGEFPDAFHEITHFAQGQGYPGLVVLKGRPLEATDMTTDARFLRTRVKEAGFHHFLCVPVPGLRRPIGSLDVAWRSKSRYDGSLCVALSREAERLALILDRERLDQASGDLREGTDDASSSEAKLVLRLLGGFEVRLDGVPMSMEHFARRRSLVLLKVLVTNYGKVIGREELVDLLWPVDPPDDAPQLLKSAAHYLRRALGEAHDEKAKTPFISTAANGYAFNPASCHWIDSVEFRKHAEQGLRFERQGRWREAIVALEAAAELYSGDYLEDEPYGEWAMRQRRQLRELFFDVLQTAARLQRSAGDCEAAVRYYRRVLDIDPCLEDVHRDLMELLARCGKRTRALRQYEMCRRALKEEFDSSPLLETEALYRSILSGHTG